MLFVTTKDNWADEIDFEGAFLTTEEEWAKYVERVEQVEGYIVVCYGTNQDNEYEADKYLSLFETKTISQADAYVLQKHLGLTVCTFEEEFGGVFLGGRTFGEVALTEIEVD